MSGAETADWNCPRCGATEPHHAMLFPDRDDFDPEFEFDVTCESVYITPIGGGPGFAFSHEEFEQAIAHYEARP